MRRQQFGDDAPIGLAAEDMIVEVAGLAEALEHGLALGFAADAAADEQRAVYIEEDKFHGIVLSSGRLKGIPIVAPFNVDSFRAGWGIHCRLLLRALDDNEGGLRRARAHFDRRLVFVGVVHALGRLDAVES